MATHSTNLAWKLPWTEEADGLQYMRSQRVEHNWVTERAHTHAWARKLHFLKFNYFHCPLTGALLILSLFLYKIGVYFSLWVYFPLKTILVSFSPFFSSVQFSSIQLLSCVQLFVIPWTTVLQASLSITNSQRSLRLRSMESVMPSSHLILCPPLLLLPPIPPSITVFSMSQLFAWGGQSTGDSALASFLPKKSQGWSPLEWTGWISWQSKGLSRVFSNTTVQKHQFFRAQPSSQSNSHIHTWPQEKP